MQDQKLRDIVKKMSSEGYSKDDIGKVVNRYNQKKIPTSETKPPSSKFSYESLSPHIRGFGADEEAPGALDKINEVLFEPKTDFFSRQAAKISEPMLRHSEDDSPDRTTTFPLGPTHIPVSSKTLGRYGGAFTQAVGQGIDALTAPGNIALGAASGVRNLAGSLIPRSTLPLADRLRKIQGGTDVAMKALGLPIVAGGLKHIEEGEHVDEKLLGALEVLMGGMAARPRQPTQGGINVEPKFAGRSSTTREPAGRLTQGDNLLDGIRADAPIKPGSPKTGVGEIVELGGKPYEITGYEVNGKPKLRPVPESEFIPPDLPEKDWGRRPDEVLPPEGDLPELVKRFGESIGELPVKPETTAKVNQMFPGMKQTQVADPIASLSERMQRLRGDETGAIGPNLGGPRKLPVKDKTPVKFAFEWPDFNENGTPERMYTVLEGPEKGSTLSERTLKERGIDIPGEPINLESPIVQGVNQEIPIDDLSDVDRGVGSQFPGEEAFDIGDMQEARLWSPDDLVPDDRPVMPSQRGVSPEMIQRIKQQQPQSDLPAEFAPIEQPPDNIMAPPDSIQMSELTPEARFRNFTDDEALEAQRLMQEMSPETTVTQPKLSLFNRIMKAGDDFAADESGEFRFEDDRKGQIAKFPQGGNRQVYDIAEQLYNTQNPKLSEKLVNDLESVITRETNPEIIADNVRQLEGYVEAAQLSGNNNLIEEMGFLRDIAEDHRRMKTGAQLPIKDEQRSMSKYAAEELGDFGLASDVKNMFDDTKPQFARSDKGGIKIGVNVKRAADEVTKSYSRALPAIMVREGLQNSIDPIRHTSGFISLKLGRDGRDFISITDTGKGMTRDELETKLTNLHDSGKVTDEKAGGGKGVGSASYLLGGDFVEVTSTAKHEDGTIRTTSFESDPDSLMEHADVRERTVSSDTPVGTKFKVRLREDQDITEAQMMFDDFINYSRDLPGHIMYTPPGHTSPERFDWKSFKDDTIISQESVLGNKITIAIPKGDRPKPYESMTMDVIYLNNGQYQFETGIWVEKVKDLPSKVIVNIEPTAEEGTTGYPFLTSREQLKDNIKSALEELIVKRIANPKLEAKKSILRELYAGMDPVNIVTTSSRKSVIYDSGKRMTPEEMEVFKSDAEELMQTYNEIVNDVLEAVGRPRWIDKVEQVGLLLLGEDKGSRTHGIHIPNPDTPTSKSTILFNPFHAIADFTNPRDAAIKNMMTILHEVSHVGEEQSGELDVIFEASDLADPRIGVYLQDYLTHLVEQGGLDPGHGMDFIKRLGEVHAKVGVPRAFTAIDRLAEVFSGGDVGRYSPTIQRLLQVYTESRGRTQSVEDVLSGTGIKSADRTSPGKGDISSNIKPDGKRTVAKEYLGREQIDESLPVRNRIQPKHPQPGVIEQLWNLPRGLMSVDLPFITSAAFRQASPLAWTSAWYKSWIPSIKAYGEEAVYRASETELRDSEYFRPRYEPKYKKGEIVGYKEAPSIAEEMGIKLADLDDLSGREEHIRATLAEKIPIWGRHVRASNRGYVSFLNHLRRYRLEDLMNQAKFAGVEDDMTIMKQIGEFLNDATGRSSLKTKVGPNKEISFEAGSRKLAMALWSPRLMWSRIRMLNPMTYIKMDPRVRKEYLKGLLRAGANWWGFAGLALLAKETLGIEVEVGLNPTSSDFGKVRFGYGDTRVDAGAGFQQFLVAAARFAMNKSTSAGSEKTTEFGEGFRPRTRKTLTEDFITSKFHPNAKLAYDLLNVSNDRPVHVFDRIMQNAIPLVAQDISEIMEEEPGLALALAPLISSGLGANTFGANKRYGDPVFTDSIEDYLDMDRRSLSGTVKKW